MLSKMGIPKLSPIKNIKYPTFSVQNESKDKNILTVLEEFLSFFGFFEEFGNPKMFGWIPNDFKG